jgi:hypothetical protein
VSCPSADFYAAVGGSGYALTYNGSSWSFSDIDGSNLLTSVSCPSANFCVAVDNVGNAITYTSSAVPAVTCVSPTTGTTAGGTTVTITGTKFTGATKVVFGAVAAANFSVVSSTKITAVSPAEAAAAHNVYVTTPGGTSAAVAGDVFTYT